MANEIFGNFFLLLILLFLVVSISYCIFLANEYISCICNNDKNKINSLVTTMLIIFVVMIVTLFASANF